MNQISPLLSSSNIVFIKSMQHTTKKRVFEEASLIFQMQGVPHTTVFDALFARERLGNNALGGGAILPHCRLEGIDRPLLAIAILARPIAIDPTPPDTKPVDIFLFLVVPESDDDEAYIPLLRECISMLEDRDVLAKLRTCENAVEVCSVIMDWAPPSAVIMENQDDQLAKEWERLNEEVEKVQELEEQERFGRHRLPPEVVAVETDPELRKSE